MNKIRVVAQVVGFCTMGLLALYGLLALCGVAGPLGLAAEADAGVPNTPGEAAAVLGSDIPQTMNYQGFLRDPDGSLTTGSYTITARIYSSATLGTMFYETTVPNVTVRDGLFNIVLGDDPAFPADAFSEVPRYIGIDLNDGGGELIPRQRLHAVPWALTASTASTLVDNAPAQSVQGLSSSGDITLTDGSGIMARDNGASSTLYVQNEGGDLDVGGRLLGQSRPIVFHANQPLGSKPEFPLPVYFTEYRTDEYQCMLVGLSAEGGDIDEGPGFTLVARMMPNFPLNPDRWTAILGASLDASFSSVFVDYLCIPNGLIDFQHH